MTRLALATQLRALSNVSADQRLEVLRRLYLFPRLFILGFQDEEKEKAKKAFSQLVQEAAIADVDYPILVANYIDGTGKLPDFIENHLEEFLNLARFLAWGDSDIERTISSDLHLEAKHKALLIVQDEMTELYSK